MIKLKITAEAYEHKVHEFSFDLHGMRENHEQTTSDTCDECRDLAAITVDYFFQVRDFVSPGDREHIKLLRDFIDENCNRSVESAAATIGVSPLTVYRWLNLGGPVAARKRRTRNHLRRLGILFV